MVNFHYQDKSENPTMNMRCLAGQRQAYIYICISEIEDVYPIFKIKMLLHFILSV